ncbi:MAG: phosphoenolpyruvate carboxykinase [Armatimonadetes bacterium]|nr:phosphoenolpyruvate carboxykinase [Armatimonadota bacterium]
MPIRWSYADINLAIEQLRDQDNVSRPDIAQLRRMVEPHGNRTEFGSLAFSSSVRARSKDRTVIIGGPDVQQTDLNDDQKRIMRDLPETLDAVHSYMQHCPIVSVARSLGNNKEFSPHCTIYVSTHRKDCVRLPFMWSEMLFDPRIATGPEMNLVYIPEWQEKDRQALVFPEIGVTYVLGTDYFGEAKKAFLRMAMWFAKARGMLGIHAGSKLITARTASGKLKRYGMLLLGLTATGKTTHSAHTHYLEGEGEEVKLVQDDVVFWRADGSALGSEAGLFIKTDSLEDGSQPALYEAAKSPRTIFENVMVDYLGRVYMSNEVLTGNGRAVVQRSDLGDLASDSIDLPPVDELDGLIIAFITRRNTILPPVARLTPAQAAAAFMLGESVHTSGSNPLLAGQSIRVVGTNPFICGDEAFEGNRFYEFVCNHPDKIQCYQLNTGGVGEIIVEEHGERVVKQKVNRVEIAEMAAIIRGIVREEIEWEDEPVWGTQVPKKVVDVDLERFDPRKYYDQEMIDRFVEELRMERREHLESFEGLHPDILTALKL